MAHCSVASALAGSTAGGQDRDRLTAVRLRLLAATALALAAPRAWSEQRALRTADAAPIESLEVDWDCTAIARARQAAPGAWHPLGSNLAAARRPDVLWLRVGTAADGDSATAAGWTVSMPSNRAFSLSTYEAPAYAEERIDAADSRAWQLSFRQLGREVRPHAGGPSYLCFAGPRLGAEELELLPTPVFRARDLNATQWRAAAFGVILAMSLFSALFYLALNERVFLKYLGYLLVFVLYLACETRAAHRMPLLSGLDVRDMARVTGMSIDLASAFAFLFALEFMSLPRLAPRSAAVLRFVAGALAPLTLAHGAAFIVASDALVEATIRVSNVLVGGGALLLLFTVARCAWRGDRYARFFFAGWTPLVLTAFAASAQQLFWSRTLAVTLDAMLIAGALESVVLSFGLADRTLGYRRELDRATQLADHDPLSGLLNRRALLRLTRALDTEGERRGGALALVIFDLDHFKRINDTHGHSAGDACIRVFAEHLRAEMRRSDLAARYGGEEFLAVLPGASRDAAVGLAERVRARVEREGAVAGSVRVAMTVSAGVAVGDAREGFEGLVVRADRALYAAKNAGRNQVIADGAPGSPPPKAAPG
jgi:diguanylate cyclase (GGDEF)-like protein